MTRFLSLSIGVVLLLAAALISAQSDDAPASRRSLVQTPVQGGTMVRAHGNFTVAQAAAFDRFEIYSVGDSFEQLSLDAVLRADANPYAGEEIRADFVNFIYGSCEIVEDQGCMAPIQIQVWNACQRNRGTYSGGPLGLTPDEELRVRGAPAAFFDDFSRLELYTGKATVVIFSSYRDRALLLRVAHDLRPVNAIAHQETTLPSPQQGVENKRSATCRS